MLNDDTQRYGLLKDDALIIICTNFKIGVYTSKSCLYIPDIWVRHLAAADSARKSLSSERLQITDKAHLKREIGFVFCKEIAKT